METNEKELSPQESILLIQAMISKTKSAVADNSFYLLFWGWLAFACCISQYILKVYLHFPHHYIVWALMPVGGIISGLYSSRQQKRTGVKTFVEEALDYLWMSIALAFIALVTINMSSAGAWQTAFTYYILLYAIGTFVTGSLIRFKPLIYGGLFNFVLAALSVQFGFDNQLLVGALALLTSYIVPGHLLRLRYQKQK